MRGVGIWVLGFGLRYENVKDCFLVKRFYASCVQAVTNKELHLNTQI